MEEIPDMLAQSKRHKAIEISALFRPADLLFQPEILLD
jgi:hypothetical protein